MLHSEVLPSLYQKQQCTGVPADHFCQVPTRFFRHAGGHVRGQVLHAFAAWLKLSAGAGLDGPALASHPLTIAAMEGLKSTDTFEDASDAVCELVLCTSSRGSPEPQMMPLVQLLVPAVRMQQLSSAPQHLSACLMSHMLYASWCCVSHQKGT